MATLDASFQNSILFFVIGEGKVLVLFGAGKATEGGT